MSDSVNQKIMLVIRKREKVLFEGEIRAFTSTNERGIFDVLYTHANFISIIDKYCLIHRLDGTRSEMKIGQGIVRVKDNRVNVYLGID